MRRKVPSAALVTIFLTSPAWPVLADQADRDVVFRVGPLEVLGEGPSYAEVGVGAFNALDQDGAETESAAKVELRVGEEKLWFVGPAVGLMATGDGGVFGYGGFYADVAWGNVVLTPLLGIGGYTQGDSKDLGGVFQFRTGFGAAYEFTPGMRLGVSYAHVSNAHIHDENPGEEELYLTYALSF